MNVLGALDTAKLHTSVLEGLICCHLQQKALPGSSRQERQPGTAAPLPGSPSETTAGLQSMGVFPSSRGQPTPRLLPALSGWHAPARFLLSHLPQPLVPADRRNAIRLLRNLYVAKDEAYLQPLVTREHLYCNRYKEDSLPLLATWSGNVSAHAANSGTIHVLSG